MPKNDVYIRSLSGIVFLAAVIVPVVLGAIPFFILMIVISTLCLLEFLKMQKQNDWVNLTFVLIVNLLLLFENSGSLIESIYANENLSYWQSTLPFLIFLSLIYIIIQLKRKGLALIPSVTNSLFSIIYIAVPFALFIKYLGAVEIVGEVRCSSYMHYDWRQPMFVFILVWSSDTFAYVSGRLLGKHLLFPKLSPKKTIEGLIGGTILAGAAGGILAGLWNNFGISTGVLLGALVSVFGTAGDLFASALKRNAGVKDTGNLIPGHGGVLDRFDAFIFASLIVSAWYELKPLIHMLFYRTID